MVGCGYVRQFLWELPLLIVGNCFVMGFRETSMKKIIGIREFSERLAQDFFNNKFSPDIGTPAKNIPPIDEVYDGDTVSTCRALQFSSCISLSTAVSTISDMTLNSASTIYIGSEHIAEKEEAKLGGRYNMLSRGYFSGNLPNGKICLHISLWFYKGYNRFNKKVYYCQQVHHIFLNT